MQSEDYERCPDVVPESSIRASSSDCNPQPQSTEHTNDSYINRIMNEVKLEEVNYLF